MGGLDSKDEVVIDKCDTAWVKGFCFYPTN